MKILLAEISLLIFSLGSAIAASDYYCTRVGGQCKNDWLTCNKGIYVSGRCAGSARRKCCIRGNDKFCMNIEGSCQYDGKNCAGKYVTGLCAGNKRRRCCVTSDYDCTRVGGRCQEDWKNCYKGTYGKEFCPSGTSQRCCIRGNDTRCTSSGGNCHHDGYSCSGKYHTGLCAGNKHRKCCKKVVSVTEKPECSDTAVGYACKILFLHRAGDILLRKSHDFGRRDNAFAYNNIEDMCNRHPAKLSMYRCAECPYPGPPGGTVYLHKTLLCYIAKLADNGYIQVNEIAGGCHSCQSRHYRGLAVDLKYDSYRHEEYTSTCRSMGGRPFEKTSKVIHCQF